jgi:hypothetical protein
MTLEAPPEYGEATAAAVDALRRDARYAGADVDIRLDSELTLDALSDLVASIGADLVVIESTVRGGVRLAAQLRNGARSLSFTCRRSRHARSPVARCSAWSSVHGSAGRSLRF